MKTLKKLFLIVPLSHLFGIGLLALLCTAGKNAADPNACSKTIGIVSLLAAGVLCGLLSAVYGRFDCKTGLLTGAVFSAVCLLAGLLAGNFTPTVPAIAALTAAAIMPALLCLRPHGGKMSARKSRKRAAARYFAK